MCAGVEMIDRGQMSKDNTVVQVLLARHDTSIRRIISRRSGPEVLRRTTIDDLHQETVTIAMESASNFVFHDDARFLGWVSTIVRRVIARSVQSRRYHAKILRLKRPESSGLGVPETELQAKIRTPSSVAAGKEQRVALSRALQALPPHYRRVLVLYKLDGRSLAEVAVKMERSKGATARLIGRAVQALREEMMAR